MLFISFFKLAIILSQFLFIYSLQISKMERIVLVTGGNKGIGKAIAKRLGKEMDTKVIIGCRNSELGIQTVNELKAIQCNVVYCNLDLNDHDSIVATADFIEKEYGKIDVLINNAAVCYNDPTLCKTLFC